MEFDTKRKGGNWRSMSGFKEAELGKLDAWLEASYWTLFQVENFLCLGSFGQSVPFHGSKPPNIEKEKNLIDVFKETCIFSPLPILIFMLV